MTLMKESGRLGILDIEERLCNIGKRRRRWMSNLLIWFRIGFNSWISWEG